MSTGVLLLNFGGPANLKEVKPFLYRLFSDPDVLVGLPGMIRAPLAYLISQVKGPGSVRMYAAIGGRSPIVDWTLAQAKHLEIFFKNHPVETHFALGMRLSSPFVSDGLLSLREKSVKKLILLPFFPQFSTTTTGSCFKEVYRQLKILRWKPEVVEIRSWADHPGYIRLLRQTLQETLERAQAENPQKPYVLFSAHSLPEKIIEKGDTYPQDVDKTVENLTSDLNHPWSLAFQSRNGPIPWLKPYTEEEIIRLGRQGVKNLVVVPVSFVSDHIETLFEIDQLFARIAQKSGIETYRRSRSFNDDPEFASVLKDLILEHQS